MEQPAPAPTLDGPLMRAGVLALLIAVAWNVGLDARALAGATSDAGITVERAPVLLALRTAFLAIAGAAWLRLHGRTPTRWRAPVGIALAVLGASLVADLLGVIAAFGVIADLTGALGDLDDVHRRLFRLGAMASRAVPTLLLLAACEHARGDTPIPARPSGAAELVLRFEPLVFAIGAGTLALLLVLSAFVHKEIAWALPVGSDTTLLGCAAAAIRARRRADTRAFMSWLVVCLSMATGLLMGLFAFGGPAPEPAFLGAYDNPPRVLLRDAHVLAIAGAIASIAWATQHKERT